jgi:predicted lipid carrier protein YhbT
LAGDAPDAAGPAVAVRREWAEEVRMATPQDVEDAVHTLVAKLAAVDPDVRRRYCNDRTVSCQVSDLGLVWSGRLGEQGLQDVTTDRADRAQVRLSVSSDDLVALAEGRLAPAAAWAVGRLRVQAGPMDLLLLRTLL